MHSEVVGISVPFMVVDMLGGVFSDLSLVFKPPPFNTIAAISYSLVVVSSLSDLYWRPPLPVYTLVLASTPSECFFSFLPLLYVLINVEHAQFFDGIVLLAAAILNPLANRRRKRAALAARGTRPPHGENTDGVGGAEGGNADTPTRSKPTEGRPGDAEKVGDITPYAFSTANVYSTWHR